MIAAKPVDQLKAILIAAQDGNSDGGEKITAAEMRTAVAPLLTAFTRDALEAREITSATGVLLGWTSPFPDSFEPGARAEALRALEEVDPILTPTPDL